MNELKEEKSEARSKTQVPASEDPFDPSNFKPIPLSSSTAPEELINWLSPYDFYSSDTCGKGDNLLDPIEFAHLQKGLDGVPFRSRLSIGLGRFKDHFPGWELNFKEGRIERRVTRLALSEQGLGPDETPGLDRETLALLRDVSNDIFDACEYPNMLLDCPTAQKEFIDSFELLATTPDGILMPTAENFDRAANDEFTTNDLKEEYSWEDHYECFVQAFEGFCADSQCPDLFVWRLALDLADDIQFSKKEPTLIFPPLLSNDELISSPSGGGIRIIYSDENFAIRYGREEAKKLLMRAFDTQYCGYMFETE